MSCADLTPNDSCPPAAAAAEREAPSELPGALVLLLAVATGALVANLYYAQPLIALIGPQVGLRPDLYGLLVSVTQIGYGVGLFLLVPLGDVMENRRLVMLALAGTFLGLIGAATAHSAWMFMATSFVIGVCSTGAQVLLPYAAHLAPPARRGRVVGNIMAGVLTGIMLARPAALGVAAWLGWRWIFGISAGGMVVIGVALMRMMPARRPEARMAYGRILLSMWDIFKGRNFRGGPVLKWRAAYQALLFAAFNVFWTVVPIMLAERFGWGEEGIALFALAGAGGALAAPLAGRWADRGWTRAATIGAMLVLSLAFYATGWAAAAGWIVMLTVLTVLIDASVQVNQVVSQRIIFSLSAEARGRINAIYMTIMFMGGAIGSTLGAAAYHHGGANGWSVTANIGAAMGAAALALYATQARKETAYHA